MTSSVSINGGGGGPLSSVTNTYEGGINSRPGSIGATGGITKKNNSSIEINAVAGTGH